MSILMGPIAYAVTSLSDPLATGPELLDDARVTSRPTPMTPPSSTRRRSAAHRLHVFLHRPALVTGDPR